MCKRGPKTQYDSKLHSKLIGWLCRTGLTDKQIALEIGISSRQLYRWYREYLELCEAKNSVQIIKLMIASIKGRLSMRWKKRKMGGQSYKED